MKNLLALLLFSHSLFAQSDSLSFNESIEKLTTDENSDYYYPKLLQKLRANQLAGKEYLYLYYGQIYISDYRALKVLTSPQNQTFLKAVANGNCKKAIPLGTQILEDNPVDLTTLLHTCTCIKNTATIDEKNLINRFTNLLETILSTGDGKTMDTAIKIANLEDDYVMKGILGFLGGQESLAMHGKHSYSVWTKGNQKLYFEDIIHVKWPK